MEGNHTYVNKLCGAGRKGGKTSAVMEEKPPQRRAQVELLPRGCYLEVLRRIRVKL